MTGKEIDLARKHLPQGWKLEYRIMLVPPDGREPRLIPPESWPDIMTWAKEAEERHLSMAAFLSGIIGHRIDPDPVDED